MTVCVTLRWVTGGTNRSTVVMPITLSHLQNVQTWVVSFVSGQQSMNQSQVKGASSTVRRRKLRQQILAEKSVMISERTLAEKSVSEASNSVTSPKLSSEKQTEQKTSRGKSKSQLSSGRFNQPLWTSNICHRNGRKTPRRNGY